MHNKANNKLKSGELKEAELTLEKILEIDPSYAPAHVTFSKLWLQRAELSKANEYATLAVRIDEDFRPWWDELNDISIKIQSGRQKAQQADYENAMIEYKTIVKKYPYYPEVHYYMGITKFKQRDFKGAALYFEQALKIYPKYQKAQKGLNNVSKRLRK
tara:strand:- start:318 stop:794 length:477 start_codon:yes stop_codon:yes gene_type:complete